MIKQAYTKKKKKKNPRKTEFNDGKETKKDGGLDSKRFSFLTLKPQANGGFFFKC